MNAGTRTVRIFRDAATLAALKAFADGTAGTQTPGKTTPRNGAKLVKFEAHMSLESPDAKKFDEVKDKDGTVVNYRNVRLKGYLSTFKATTESDRHGDYVEPGAFEETIPRFMKNPVLLVNHMNAVSMLAGSFTKVQEDKKGLYVEAVLSDAPSDAMTDIRFKVAEGHLRTLSMGGRFHYKEDGRGIFKVDLWEGSLTPIPANPDATFSTRELTADENERHQNEG